MIGGDTKPTSFTTGDIILVTGRPTNMKVVVTSSSGTQECSLHFSCSGELKIGDNFGSFRLIGFVNELQGAVGNVSNEDAEIDADPSKGKGSPSAPSKEKGSQAPPTSVDDH